MTTAGAIASSPGRRPALCHRVVALAAPAAASTTLDFITFDGIDYIRWPEEPGRA